MGHEKHHYVPRFYLAAWEGVDQKIACYRWVRNHIHVSRLSPKNVAFERDLYALRSVPDDQKQVIEKKYFAEIVDEKASHVSELLKSESPYVLNHEQRVQWARFLLSFRARLPALVRKIEEEAAPELVEALLRDPDEYEKLRRPEDPGTLLEWVRVNFPATIENFGVRLVPSLIEQANLLRDVYQMHWWTQTLDSGNARFLTSDNPCVYTKGLRHQDCVIALPLSPKVVFLAANRTELETNLRNQTFQAMAIRTNQSVVSQAFEYVYGQQSNQRFFVRKHLKRAASTS